MATFGSEPSSGSCFIPTGSNPSFVRKCYICFMRSLYLLLAGFASSLWAQLVNRFIDPVFSQVRVIRGVQYGSNIDFAQTPVNLYMDVYEPLGDTMQKRPVIILIHAGSFLQPSIASSGFGRTPIGTRVDSGIVALCLEFARRGYVAISADHRVGWNFQATTQEARAQGIIQAVWRAVQDGRALVRYLRKDAATTNSFRIDSNRIAMGGSSSGAYVGLHVAYLNRPEELDNPKFKLPDGTLFVDTTDPGMDRGSGPNAFEGGSGNPGYPSTIQAVLNLGGAIGDTSFIQDEGVPVISLHGVQDPTTPYTSGVVVTAVGNYPIIEVFGSYALHENLELKGNLQTLKPEYAGDQPFPGLYPWQGAGFEPFGWYANSTDAEKARARRYVDTVVWFAAPRLFKVLQLPTIQMPAAPTLTQVIEITALGQGEKEKVDLQVFPSPASSPELMIRCSVPFTQVDLFTLEGHRVAQQLLAPTDQYLWNLPSGLPAGLYLLRITTPHITLYQRWSYQP